MSLREELRELKYEGDGNLLSGGDFEFTSETDVDEGNSDYFLALQS